MKTVAYLILGLIIAAIIYALGTALRIALLPARVVDRSFSTVEGVIDKTLTADNAIYNYEWFKRQIEAIKATKNKATLAQQNVANFEASAGTRKDWTFEDKTEYARLSSVAAGLNNQVEDMVAEYNARAKMATRNIFEDGKIPQVLEMGSSFLR